MYAFMRYQTALFSECLITLATDIRAQTTMCGLMCHQMRLMNECLLTNIAKMLALTAMYASMCYEIALFTECLLTHFTCIWMLTPTYITGKSAFITVHMKLFIQTDLGKTQKLNIRIYCDRRDNYLYGNVTLNKNSLHLKSCVV